MFYWSFYNVGFFFKVVQYSLIKNNKQIIVDIEILKNLASIGCPDYEIASVLNVSARTLKRNYAEIIDQYKEKGKASLRKRMYEKAMKGNDKLLIWLSRQYLNMSDRIHNTNTTEPLPLIIEAKAEEVKDLNGKEKG